MVACLLVSQKLRRYRDQVQYNEMAYQFMTFLPNWMIFFHLPSMYLHQPIQDFFLNFLYQGGVKSTVSWVFEDLKFKISEGYNQNWSEPSEILNLRSSTTPETVAFTPP